MAANTISEPGIYEIDDQTYHSDPIEAGPSLSASIGKVMLAQTPMHAAFNHPKLNPDKLPTNKRVFDLGKAAHRLMLGKGTGFRAILAEDKEGNSVTGYQSKAAQEERNAAWAAGQIPLLTHEQENLMAMYKAGRKQLKGFVDSGEMLVEPFTEGNPEQCIVWIEKTKFGDVWCRSLLDWRYNDIEDMDDYKTTMASANPQDWSTFQMRKLGFTFQATFYRRGIRALRLAHDPNFRFIVHELKPPYALSIIGVDPDELNDVEEDVQRVIDGWGKCTKTNFWPGYAPRVVIPERTEWQKERDAERRVKSLDHDHLSSEDIAASL